MSKSGRVAAFLLTEIRIPLTTHPSQAITPGGLVYDPSTGERLPLQLPPHWRKEPPPTDRALRCQRVQAMVLATRLDNVITNADIALAMDAFERTRAFDGSRVLARKTVLGRSIQVPIGAIAQRWCTDQGRVNIRKRVTEVLERVVKTGDQSEERFKLITLTFKTVGESWRGSGQVREFMNTLRHHCRRRGKTISYVYVTEVQRRMAMHYHIAVAGAPWIDKKLIQSWWEHGFSDIRAANGPKAAMYMAKYVRKSTGQLTTSAELITVLHRAAGFRRWGGSRDATAKAKTVPGWVNDIDEILDGEDTIEDWGEIPSLNLAWATTTGGRIFRCNLANITWMLRSDFDSGPAG